jgi:hypothetical protein
MTHPIQRTDSAIPTSSIDGSTAVPDDDGGAGAPSLVPPPGGDIPAGGNEMLALAELLTRADQSDRANARRTESIANQAEAQQDAARVAAMKDKANQDLYGAIAQGAGDIAGGVSTGLVAGVDKPDESKWDETFRGGSQAFPGVGHIVAAVPKSAADNDDAAAAQAQAGSAVDERLSKQAHEDAQNATDSLKKVEEFLQAVNQSKNAAEQAAASFRA